MVGVHRHLAVVDERTTLVERPGGPPSPKVVWRCSGCAAAWVSDAAGPDVAALFLAQWFRVPYPSLSGLPAEVKEVAYALAEEWTGSLDELLATARALTDRPVTPEDAAAGT